MVIRYYITSHSAKIYILVEKVIFMGDKKLGREVIRNGQRGHIVHVEASDRFVPGTYRGNDPRTKAANKK